MMTTIAHSRITELLAVKRYEKPPANFFSEFILEFHRSHRSHGGIASGPKRSTKWKARPV